MVVGTYFVHAHGTAALFCAVSLDRQWLEEGQRLWQKNMTLTSEMVRVGPVRLPDWGQRDSGRRWLEALDIPTHYLNQGRSDTQSLPSSIQFLSCFFGFSLFIFLFQIVGVVRLQRKPAQFCEKLLVARTDWADWHDRYTFMQCVHGGYTP